MHLQQGTFCNSAPSLCIPNLGMKIVTANTHRLLIMLTGLLLVGCQNYETHVSESNLAETGLRQIQNQLVEASCGQCQFEMEGDGCTLAIRIGEETFWVDGSDIDDHGDAHGTDGLCNCIRQAVVSGTIRDGRFEATSFKLQAEPEKSD